MKNSLSETGLSMSQAQSISNLCNQRAIEIHNQFSIVNNCSKIVSLAGIDYEETQKHPMPKNVIALIIEKAKLHATQAFLMENIKAKDLLIKTLQKEEFVPQIELPEKPEYLIHKLIPSVEESWGWDQLSKAETNEYLHAEAMASHIGRFIHKDSILDNLRKELPVLKSLEWITVKTGEKTPVKVIIHHKSSELLSLHEELAKLHRDYEQRVNYFKAKVKNITTDRNAEIANLKADEQNEINSVNKQLNETYLLLLKEANDEILKHSQLFEANRQKEIKRAAALRINVDPQFQEVINLFLSKLPTE